MDFAAGDGSLSWKVSKAQFKLFQALSIIVLFEDIVLIFECRCCNNRLGSHICIYLA